MENQIKSKNKSFKPAKKLIIGIVLFVSFYVLYNITGKANGISDMQVYLEKNTFSFMGKALASIFSNLVKIGLGILMIYCFVSGLYRISTFSIYIPTFEDKTPGGVPVKGCDSYPNINRVLSYRESKLASMSPERAADLYVGCSKIESLYTGYSNGPETQRTLSYIESKLSSMSSDRALNYLANKL